MSDLLPCPFCGGPGERVDNGPTQKQVAYAHSWGDDVDDGGSFIHCTRCEASTAIHYDRRENLVSSWNDRDGRIREAAASVVNDWMGGEPMEHDLAELRDALGMEAAR